MVIAYSQSAEYRRWSNLHLKVDVLDDPKRRLRMARSALASALNTHRNARNAAYADYKRTGDPTAIGRYYAHLRAIDELRNVAKAVRS